MGLKFYIATGLERGEEAKSLANALAFMGHEITYAWWEHGSVQTEGELRIAEVAVSELDGVYKADLFIALLPGGRGTHTEFGAALVLRQHPFKKIVLVGPTEQDGRTCAFYLHPSVDERFANVGELLAWLRGREAAAS
jgi:hypothetical protein